MEKAEGYKVKVIGIIGAMEEEVAMLKEKMTEVTVTEKAGMEFFHGQLKGHEAVVVRSGIGKVNAGICTQILADDFHVDAVINTGIAGSLKAEINIGDIVLSTDTMHHDMDAREFGYPAGQIPGWILWLFLLTKVCGNWPVRYAARSIRRSASGKAG